MLGELLRELPYRISQDWGDTPTIFSPAIIFLFTAVILNEFVKIYRSPACPAVYATKLPLTGTWGSLKSIVRFTSFLTEAYEKYLVCHLPCTIPDTIYGSTSTLVLLPTSTLRWMLKQPASVLDHHGESQQGVQEMRYFSWLAKTPFEHPVHGASTHGWMQRWIGAQFDASKNDTMAMIYRHLDQHWGEDTEKWIDVNLFKTLRPMFNEYTWRAIVGAQLSQSKDLWYYGYMVSVLSIPASLLLHLFPSRLRPTAALIIGLPSRYVFWRLESIVMPLIHQRITEYTSGHDLHLDDYISWAVRNDAQQRGIDEDTPRRIVSLVASLGMLMNTSPSIVTHGMDELIQSPRAQEHEDSLRTEAQRALQDEDGHWTKSTLSKLHGLDSMLREILRLHPIAAVAPVQTAVADIDIPLADDDGAQVLRVRKGTRVGIAAHSIHMDATYYANPTTFEPWRFMSSRSRKGLEWGPPEADEAEAGGSHTKQQALLSPTNMWFGWGMGRGSCPGRWIAHDTLKLVFSAILIRYEVKATTRPSMMDGRRKIASRFGPFLPPSNSRILIRRRKHAD